MAPTLETERLLLRPVTPDDADEIHALHTDDAVMRHLTSERVRREDVRSGTIPRMLAWERQHPDWGYAAAAERSTGAFLGWLVLRPAMDRAPEPGELEVGWRFHRAAWGHGYATEGAAALVRHAFTALDTRWVFATTMAVNTPSRRVMERLGMRHVRTFHEDHADPLPGTEHGEVEYRLTRDEWLARSG